MNDINSIFDSAGFLFGSDREIDKLYDESNTAFNNDILNFLEPLISYATNEYTSDSGLSRDHSCSPTTTEDLDNNFSINRALVDNTDDDLKPAEVTIKSVSGQLERRKKLDVLINDGSSIKSPLSSDDGSVKDEITIDGDESVLPFIDSDSSSANDFFILSEDGEFDYASPSPILLSYPESRTLKLVSPNLKNIGKKVKHSTGSIRTLKIRTVRKRNLDEYASDKDVSDDSTSHPRLQLTPEEQKLARKEGITLPSHYPLTKAQERDLKRIRRKIRNKISAQDSRRRKKEYVDSLEEKVKQATEENDNLIKRIKTLENQRLTLSAQVRKLQAVLARSTNAQSTQPSSTCLLVLIMSMALLLAPNLRNSTLSKESNEDEGISLSEDGTTSALNSVRAASKNLLFSHKAHEGQCNIEEETKTLTEQLKSMQLPDAKILTGLLEMMKVKIHKEDSLLPNDHDYFRPRKRTASEANDNRSDNLLSVSSSLSPLKIMKNSQNFVDDLMTATIINQNSMINDLETLVSNEPVTVIDLSE